MNSVMWQPVTTKAMLPQSSGVPRCPSLRSHWMKLFYCVRALAALSSWLKADISVESAMSEPYCAKSIVFLFQRLDGAEFEQALEPLLDACNTSPRFVRALLDVSADLKRYLFVLEIGHKLKDIPAQLQGKPYLKFSGRLLLQWTIQEIFSSRPTSTMFSSRC